MSTAGRTAVIILTLSFFSLFDYDLALGQGQSRHQSFTYQNSNLGVSIQYPSDWRLEEKSNDKLNFIKQEGLASADLNVEDIDQSDCYPTRIRKCKS